MTTSLSESSRDPRSRKFNYLAEKCRHTNPFSDSVQVFRHPLPACSLPAKRVICPAQGSSNPQCQNPPQRVISRISPWAESSHLPGRHAKSQRRKALLLLRRLGTFGTQHAFPSVELVLGAR